LEPQVRLGKDRVGSITVKEKIEKHYEEKYRNRIYDDL
jgi:hypothetical protein